MSANVETTAPIGRKKLARGTKRSAAASGYGQNTSSPAGAKKGSWPVVPLSELAADERNSVTDGPFGSKLKTEHYTAAGPRVIRLKNIGDAEFVDAKAHISDAHFSTLQKHRAFAGDIVIAALGENPPRSCLVPESLGPAIVKADCIRFKAGPRVLPKFLNYVLNAPDLRRHAKGIIHGVGRPRLNLGEIKALPIPVPSLPEQQQIVAEIEKQFTRLEAGVAGLRRVQAKLKRYRAAVLKAACEGRLVPTEAELAKAETRKFETGEELFARILNERRKNCQGGGKSNEPAAPDTENLPPLPVGWVWATVEQLSTRVQYGSSAKTNEDSRGVPVLRMGNIQEGKFDFAKLKYLPGGHGEFPELLLAIGDLLFNRTNSAELVGKTAVYRGMPDPCSFASYLIRVRLCDGSLPDFVVYYINSIFGRAWIAGCVSQQVGQANVNGAKLKALAVPLPPLAEQKRIVAEVERRLSMVEELESVVSANLQRSVHLRQCILKQAFTDVP